MRLLIILIMFAFTLTPLKSQIFIELEKPADIHAESVPAWASMMYSDNPNVFEVDYAYESYFKNNEFQKTIHTQYYKKWRREIANYLDDTGNIEIPSAEEFKARRAKLTDNKNNRLLAEKNWECLGPFETFNGNKEFGKPISRHVNVYTIDQSLSNPDVVYCGTESGGIFKTTDKGLNWFPLSYETIMRTVTSIKVDPENPDIVYAGANSAAYFGQGNRGLLWKSVDGGSNWDVIFEVAAMGINDISINPNNTDILLIATSKGLHRSIDAGANWTEIMPNTSYDIEIKPDDSNIYYCAIHNGEKNICSFHKSTDLGLTWSIITDGWYESDNSARRNSGARLAVTEADPEVVYAVLIGDSKPGDNGYIGIYRSNDAGESWMLPNPPTGGPYNVETHPCLTTFNPNASNPYNQGFYNLGFAVSDSDPNLIYAGFLNTFKSADGGKTFEWLGGYGGTLKNIHPDCQEIEINGDDFWLATDGGVNYSDIFPTDHDSRTNGITGSDYWGFDVGWNEDVLVGGRYHNGNSIYCPAFPKGVQQYIGGGEAPTGYINPLNNKKAYFSDLGGRYLPDSLHGAVKNFSQGLYPTESYWRASSSELEFDPRHANVMYLGNEDKLWKSIDGGISYVALYTFPGDIKSKVLHIEISRSNPDVIYCSQTVSGAIWKTTDAGKTWNQTTILPYKTSNILLAMSAEDENILWAAAHTANAENKIFKTTDGGETWENLTTEIFGAERPISILHQAGTDGGIYLATSNSVYYRDNTMDDWILYSEGLPVNAASNILKPFYRDGKIRMATYGRGIWQCDFYSKSNPVAQPIVDKHTSINLTDTFRFDDYSILNHVGASWEWEFPGAKSVSSNTDRNPKVVYAATGQYDVTLTVTDGDGKTDSKTVINMVTVGQINNTPGILPGLASYTNEKTEFTQIENLGLETNTMTISAWVRPEGIQPDYTGIVMNDGTGAGFNFKQDNMIGYHWPEGGAWWRNSELIIAEGEWSHVAMVVEPDGITLYVNGISNKHEFTVAKANIGEMKIGRYMSWSGRNYTGFIDEVCIWDRSLTAEEIRESRHNVKNPDDDESIIAYFQFDEEDGLVVNRAGTIHAGMTHGSERLISTAPFGKGNVNRKDISTGGDISFEDSDVEIDFSNSTADEGSEIVATRIMNAPDTETGHPNTSLGYWIIDDYTANVDFSAITKMKFNSVGEIDADGAADPSVFKLYQRTENADAVEWALIDEADEATEGSHGDITFSQGLNIEAFGQFIIATDATSLDVEEITKSITNINVYPNPVRSGESIRLSNNKLTNIRFELFDLNGKRVLLSRPASCTAQIQIGDLPAGIYSFRILSDQVMKFGKIVVE